MNPLSHGSVSCWSVFSRTTYFPSRDTDSVDTDNIMEVKYYCTNLKVLEVMKLGFKGKSCIFLGEFYNLTKFSLPILIPLSKQDLELYKTFSQFQTRVYLNIDQRTWKCLYWHEVTRLKNMAQKIITNPHHMNIYFEHWLEFVEMFIMQTWGENMPGLKTWLVKSI